ncbi:MAG: hypothetical protein ACPGN3_10490 [Opitutales bacterium]
MRTSRPGQNAISKLAGLTLVEVTLAIGVFTFAMAVLLGLLAPMLTDLSEVLDADETQAIVNKVEVFLDTYNNDGNPDTESPFKDVYDDISASGYLVAYIYRTVGGRTEVVSDMGAIDTAMSSGDPNDQVDRRVFVAVIYPSNVNPNAVIAGPSLLGGDFQNIEAYSLVNTYDDYPEGYLAFNVEVYSYAPPAPGDAFATIIAENIPSEAGLLLSFPTAINR